LTASKTYIYKNETLNIWTHAGGCVVFFLWSILLVTKATSSSIRFATFSTFIFGLSLVLLYAASARYHWAKRIDDMRTDRFQLYDHIGIYYLIAGSYTPYVLINMGDGSGWRVFYSIWLIAFLGTVYKLWFRFKFKMLSLYLYIAMAWLIIFDVKELIQSATPETLWYIVAGGLSYMIGTIFYANDRIPYNHPIWHLFVLGGSAFHFMGVLASLH